MKLAIAEVKQAASPATVPKAEDALPYIRQMLGELRDSAAGFDWLLAHLIEMAQIHAADIQGGVAGMEKKRRSGK